MKIAILGATGHISKCAFWVFSKNIHNEIFLFSRAPCKINEPVNKNDKVTLHEYADFADNDYDVIFNGVGVWDTPGGDPGDIFKITEHYDNLIIDYQRAHPESVSIHISSGAAYSTDFNRPVNSETKTQLLINEFKIGNFYSIAKINSEAKHRALNDLNIVDIRLFGFFSRFMSLEYNYLLSGLINKVKTGETFKVIRENFWRDYIHMDDFCNLLIGIASTRKINTAIDARSTCPVSKEELIKIFVDKYSLKVRYNDDISISKTGVKPCYYSTIETPVYVPHFSSMQTVESELKFFLGG